MLYKRVINMNFTINREKTAISIGYSKGARYISYQSNKDIRILDYGSGRLRNALYLLEEGFYNISLVDTKEQIKNWNTHKEKFKNVYDTDEIEFINKKYDYILCSYVLNTIPSYKERVAVLNNINRLLENKGVAIIEVRGPSSLNSVKYKELFNDGYICGKNKSRTFQKPYSIDEIMDFIHKESELKVIDSKLNNTNILVLCTK